MKYLVFILLMSTFLSSLSPVQAQKPADPFAHTYSIVARDSATGEMGVAVQSHWFSVGSLVSWGKSGVGVVATQAFVNPAYGPKGLALMGEGKDAETALKMLLQQDDGKAFRQLAFLDKQGHTAVHTGENCIEEAAHYHEKNFSVQANMMLNDKVVPAMAKAFKKHAALPLAERLLKVLEAAEAVGGDIRGKQSAALLVVGPEHVAESWKDKRVDLRVDDHPTPLQELSRLLQVHRAYEHMNAGDLAVEAGDMKKALKEYGAAQRLFPENLEMKYWTAIALANGARLPEALPMFSEIFKKDENWRTLTERLPKAGLLTVSEKDLAKILRQ